LSDGDDSSDSTRSTKEGATVEIVDISGLSRKCDFNHDEIMTKSPKEAGIYIVYDHAGPICVSRSSTSIRARLLVHFSRRGNKTIALAKRIGAFGSMWFRYLVTISDQQAESELIKEMGVYKLANLGQGNRSRRQVLRTRQKPMKTWIAMIRTLLRTMQVARNLTDRADGFLRHAKSLIHGRHPLCCVCRPRHLESLESEL
jgi:hypothetical protein